MAGPGEEGGPAGMDEATRARRTGGLLRGPKPAGFSLPARHHAATSAIVTSSQVAHAQRFRKVHDARLDVVLEGAAQRCPQGRQARRHPVGERHGRATAAELPGHPIAKLPATVLDGFSSRTKVQKRWGEQLAALQQKDSDGLLARARTLSVLPKRPSDTEVFRRLCDAPSPPSLSPVVVKDARGKEVATVRRRGVSSVEITLKDAALTDEQLRKLVDALVGGS